MHADGCMQFIQSVHREQPQNLLAERSMPCRRNLQYQFGRLFESGSAQRYDMQRRERVYAIGHLPIGHLHGR